MIKKQDKLFKKLACIAKWIRNHISKKLGRKLLGIIDDAYFNSFY